MKRAYYIYINYSSSFKKKDQFQFLRNVFEKRSIRFDLLFDEKMGSIELVFFSDGVDDLGSIFKELQQNEFGFKDLGVFKLDRKAKIKLKPNYKNSIVIDPLQSQSKIIGTSNGKYISIDSNNRLISLDFDAINLPQTLYKYRDWSDPNHKAILTDNKIYFAPPSSFNDHRECNLPIRFDLLTEELRRKWLLNSSKEINPGFSDKKHKEFIEYWLKESNINNHQHRKRVADHFREKLDKELGILSMTPVKNDLNMWEVFGDNRRGFCVGFDTRQMFESNETFSHGGPVEYYDPISPPIIMPMYLTSEERIKAAHTNIFSLSNDFQYENEYRLSKIHIKNRKVSFDPDSLKEVILGDLMLDEDKEEIIQLVTTNLPHAKIYQSFLTDEDELSLREL